MLNVALPSPTKEVWLKNAREFEEIWDFPHCLAAMDGEHVKIKCPSNSGSMFFNYKDYFSVVLLALVDAGLRFVVIDVGSYGRESDAAIYKKSSMAKKISEKSFNIPDASILEGIIYFE